MSSNALKGIDEIYKEMLVKSSELDKETIVDKWVNVCGIVNKLSPDHILLIFLLILHHGILENPRMKTLIPPTLKGRSRNINLPYSGRVLDSGKGVIYKMSVLPEELQKIIYCYIDTISN
jgi:hypothetical protein